MSFNYLNLERTFSLVLSNRKSSRRLRSQLAEDGCPESQLVLAKQLLQEKSVLNVNDNEENARLGVFWLIKASEQGNVEATNILRKCLETGEGITEHNYLDVKACLSTSQNEKLAKRAAREMFLSLSAGQDFITSEQLRRQMRSIDLGEPSSKSTAKAYVSNGSAVEQDKSPFNAAGDSDFNYDVDCDYSADWSGRGENFGEKLTEDHLENAAMTYSRGELPLVQRILTLTDPRNREIQNLNYLQRALFHPLQTVQQSYLRLLDHFNARYGNRSLNVLPSSSSVSIVLILIFFPFINVDNMLIFVPMFIYYCSFFAMIFTTFQMLHAKKEYSNFRVWSRLFLRYDRDGNLNTDDAEFEYCKKNLRPFIVYFLSLLINLIAYPFISEMWIPQSEFAIIALTLTFTTLYFFNEKSSTRKFDFLTLGSFAVYVLAKYPYETDGVVRQTWRFLDIELPTLHTYELPCFASQIIGSGVEFCLNFRFFFYLLMPALFVKMASRENWRGTYKVLIPHCVTLSWWQIAILSCQGATLYGLMRSTLALVGLVFFLPIVGVATVILPILAVMKQFTDFTLTPKTGLTTVLAAIPLFVAYFIDKRRNVQVGTFISKVQIFLAVISAFFLLSPSLNEFLADVSAGAEVQVHPVITWEQYSELCRKVPWSKRTAADMQQHCVHFQGVRVNWEGVVEGARIVKITNNFLKVADNFPEGVRSKLMCLYGEQYEEDCSGLSDESKVQLCQTAKQIYSKYKCHVRSWDRYDFEVTVKMKSSRWNDVQSVITLEIDDCLRNFTLLLREKDHVWFSGSLHRAETIGSDNLSVSVDEIGCINCENKSLTSQKRVKSKFKGEHFLREMQNGVKRVLNFIFNPVMMFR
ncbi:UNVERIFIED_CONTAM: hypothetical protein PYX00_004703 [Menopon gallinae]|uniref:Wolframin n=1 Tax=Menopon gallinae TaxID=328185 RepID=A0AAW2I5N4_9NEOP